MVDYKVDIKNVEKWIQILLWDPIEFKQFDESELKEMQIMRIKSILNNKIGECFVIQSVNEIYEIQTVINDGNILEFKVVIIGRYLNKDKIKSSFDFVNKL